MDSDIPAMKMINVTFFRLQSSFLYLKVLMYICKYAKQGIRHQNVFVQEL